MIILAEKPSVAKDFALALNVPFNKQNGFYQNDLYTIINCVGHLYKLLEPGEYGLSTLPILPDIFQYKINPINPSVTKTVSE